MLAQLIACDCKAQPSTNHNPNLLQEGGTWTERHHESRTNLDMAVDFKPRRGLSFLDRLDNLSFSLSIKIAC